MLKKNMMSNEKVLSSTIKAGSQELKVLSQFNYFGSFISKEDCRIEIISKAVQTMTSVAKIRIIWKKTKNLP